MADRRLFSCLIFSLSITLSLSSDVFVSIDCGSSSASYRDENGVVWTGDGNYTQTGESRSVHPSRSVSRVADTLRVFDTGVKNCYSIDSVRRGRVLIRATFHYGNYDNRSSPPTFDLLFDGNRWGKVETSSSGPVWYEVIYVMKTDWISVCVARTNPGESPFVSAIEVRGLEVFMYQYIDANYPLLLRRRVAFGSNATIRYPDDFYDRIWSSEAVNNGSIQVSSSAMFGAPVILFDRPPPAVLKHAISATSRNASLSFFMGFPPDEVPVYINWYFSEVALLQPNETRSFRIFKDNESFSVPILPPYDNCTSMYLSNFSVSSNTTFPLVPESNSTLPPLINALEVFLVGDELTNGTDMKDVQGLASLQRAFSVLQEWSGDPCLPASYSWDWIQCANRVTALNLSSFGLSGLLPNFSSMDALETINLQNNSLQGPIPGFLGTLPNLKTLNLANNQFNGSIPASLSTKSSLNLVVTGNPELCTSGGSCPAPSRNPVPSSSRSRNLPMLLITIIQSIIILRLTENLMQ